MCLFRLCINRLMVKGSRMMSEAPRVETVPNLADLGNVVPEGYSYYEKQFTPGKPLRLPNACFKWYNLYPPDTEITPEQEAQCRAFMEREAPNIKLQGELGFVILHRAGGYLLLLVTTWRNTNEMWLSVYYKEAAK